MSSQQPLGLVRPGELPIDPASVDRERLMPLHPIARKIYTIPTPPLRRAFDIAVRIVGSGGPGGSFAAFPRFGKTYAIEYLVKSLPQVFPTLPIVSVIGHLQKPPRESTFFADLYAQSGYAYVNSKDRKNMRERVTRAWRVKADSHSSSQLLLLGDEMQRLSEDELTWLIDVTNDLFKAGVRVIGIFFGQRDLVSARDVLQLSRRVDIIGRFMSRFYSFDGIASESELAQVMQAYDDPQMCSFPEGSGISYSQFFFPCAFAHGWRLESYAPALWFTFSAVKDEYCGQGGLGRALSLGMQWVSGAIESMFVEYADNDHRGFSLTDEDWAYAVEASGFASSLGQTYEPGSSVNGTDLSRQRICECG